MDKSATEFEKWNLPLRELYRMALQFYKQNNGKAIHLTYHDNLKLIAFKQQASSGPFDPNEAPALGVLDVIGKDRRLHWQMLGDITRDQAMEGFIDLLDTMCSAFRPYVEAIRKNRDENLKDELRRMEKEKIEQAEKDREQQELLEEGYKEENQKRQLQDALNTQTYQQFKTADHIKAKIAKGHYKTFNKHGRSKVWEVYAGILDSNGTEIKNVVTCKMCRNIFKLNQKTTSNLVKHKCYVLSMSKRQCEEAVDASVQTKKKCLRIAMEWAVENCRSFEIIEDSGLKKFFSFLISVGEEYGQKVKLETLLPDPITLSKNMDVLYKQKFNDMKLELTEIKENGYGVATDVWTDNYFKMSYLAVTIHYIKNGEIKNRLLALRSINGEKSTDEDIKFNVCSTLADFNCELNDKVVIVTDRDADMKSAFSLYNQIYCINHLLNNALETSIKETPDMVELYNKCSNVVEYFKKCEINSNIKTSIESLSPNRWNNTFYLLRSVSKNWLEITAILEEKNELQRIDNLKLFTIDAVVNVLNLFEESSKNLEGENCATLHWVYIYVHRLKKICDIKQHDLNVVKALKEKLISHLNEIVIKNININHKIALFLFPPTNKLKQFSENEKNTIKLECKKLMRSYAKNIDLQDNNIPTTSNISSFNTELLSDFVDESASFNFDDKVEHEILLYEKTDVEFHDEFNILKWWHHHKGEFPLLHKASCKLLATPATCAAAEKISSMAKNLISEKTAGIGKDLDTVNKLIFLHCNITNIYSEVEKICN